MLLWIQYSNLMTVDLLGRASVIFRSLSVDILGVESESLSEG